LDGAVGQRELRKEQQIGQTAQKKGAGQADRTAAWTMGQAEKLTRGEMTRHQGAGQADETRIWTADQEDRTE
jgi:hypothetical protein